ncbi:MAG: N-Acetyl-D-glucosamine ABC transport system,sugar-binding protein [Microgenomates group bacterium GW2011_GWC1_39_7b]|uniref:N-Acetyl-D-glucosamine ABC transport system,sugar-binding protein n=3 Tax=Candidatus Woeseibacteriota TaxID=1752722 RepID=A0A0G0LJT7_9BACT|nr:MAG: N-Acetyl-D-glucosamine ABC transport system,sugar-binding protein [Candidatus Woesebacteria bacterium GW2011_GWB1_39_10]KKR26770.1 MAG: N-Acetyl-D-glucosamine ABC transport system,sugar-binding protein [Microgenomates group bacterium GW2011_GWC1_39_7b]KKR73594.1 MAG: N-Acetyl-D-glucosamine ABC transport system,sugar-binding protein [Candidatus Woesebacteria bacterium GW2011_GWA2_40_7]KKS91118.1 MAG: N-Acetyl-D-glucosamine ABC transport system,sugar-binding protein [Candidatus Woesebacter
MPPQNIPQPQQPINPSILPPLPKRGFPKIFIWIGLGIVILVLIFVIFRLFSKSTPKSAAIVWWGLWEEENIVSPLISEYESSHPNIKITYIKQSPQDYRERLTNALAKATGPDIFRFHNTWVPMFRADLDLLPPSIMSSAEYSKTFYPVASSDLTSGTGIVGIPLEYDALTLYVNEDIFNKAGKTPPTTWDELRNLASQLTVKDDQGTITQSGVALGRTENVDHWSEILALLMIQNGVDLSNPTGKPAEDALSFFTYFASTDGVWNVTLPPSTQAFASGKLAMYLGPSWRAFEITQANPALKFKTVPVPQLPKDNPNQPDITYATYWAEGVWSKSTKKAAAWDFLKFLSTQDSLQKLYQSESKVRSFGEPYSRIDMANLLTSHPVLGSIITQAPGAASWYLASRTFDGPTGINSQMANYFGDAINAMTDGRTTPEKALETVVEGVKQVLTQYRLIAK